MNGDDMPPKRKPPKPDAKPPSHRQYNVAFVLEKADSLDATAKALGLEPVQLVRMIVHEHLAEYEARAALARGEKPTS